MKTFDGNREFDEIKSTISVTNWDQTKYDEGSDWVSFDFTAKDGTEKHVLYSGWNGKFLIREDNGEMVTECSDEYDDVPWYSELLNTIYKSAEAA